MKKTNSLILFLLRLAEAVRVVAEFVCRPCAEVDVRSLLLLLLVENAIGEMEILDYLLWRSREG